MSIQGSFNNNLNSPEIGTYIIARTLQKNHESDIIREKKNRLKVLELEIAKAKDQGQPYSELEKLYKQEKIDLENYLISLQESENKSKRNGIIAVIIVSLVMIVVLIICLNMVYDVTNHSDTSKISTISNYSNTSSAEVTQKVYVGYTTIKQCQYCHRYFESDAYLKIHINEYHPKYATSIKLYFDKRLMSVDRRTVSNYKNDYNGPVMAWVKGMNVYSDNIYNIILDNSKSDEINIIEYRFNNKFIKGTPYFYFKIDSEDFKEALSGIESFCFFKVFGSQNQTIPEVYKIYLNNLNEYDDNYYCINLLQDVVLEENYLRYGADGFGIRICVNPNNIVKFKEMFLSSEVPSDNTT